MVTAVFLLVLFGSFMVAVPIVFVALILNILFRKRPIASKIIRVLALLSLIGYYIYAAQGEVGRNAFFMTIYWIGFSITYLFYLYIDKKINFDKVNALKKDDDANEKDT